MATAVISVADCRQSRSYLLKLVLYLVLFRVHFYASLLFSLFSLNIAFIFSNVFPLLLLYCFTSLFNFYFGLLCVVSVCTDAAMLSSVLHACNKGDKALRFLLEEWRHRARCRSPRFRARVATLLSHSQLNRSSRGKASGSSSHQTNVRKISTQVGEGWLCYRIGKTRAS